MRYFVTAIGTDSGKTLVSSILCEALYADYWKPIQAGKPFDADMVKSLISNSTSNIFPSTFNLEMAASPHAAAKAENVEIHLNDFDLPPSDNLVVEGAGGCYVPINDENVVIDLATRFSLKVILVSNYYLGSINHTLLTFEALKRRGLFIEGIIFNGDRNEESRRIMLKHTGLDCLLDISREAVINQNIVKNYAKTLNENWKR